MSPYTVVLGVAQDGGHPQPGCRRSCCAGATTHLTTCVAVFDEGRAWLLDAGPDFRMHLHRVEEHDADLAGILLTHAHIGHYTGLLYLGREAMDTTLLPVWAPARLADFITNNGPWEQLVAAGNIDLRVVEDGETFELSANVTVNAFTVPHRDEYSETVGYRVAGPNRAIIYVPDTDTWDGWDTSIEEHLDNCDVALLDATFFDADELPDRDLTRIAHPLVVDSLRRFSALPDPVRARIHFTHLNHTNPLLNTESSQYIRVARAGMSVAAAGTTHAL